MTVIKPSYGPITQEEYDHLLKIENRRAAIKQMINDCIEMYEETNAAARDWWNEIREEYGVTEKAVVIDPESLMIRPAPSEGGH